MASSEIAGNLRGPSNSGILVLNKPDGISSRKIVDRVARLIPRSKVGHAGTLDPLATGVLIVCVGPATRLVENVQSLPKAYRTLIRLGREATHSMRMGGSRFRRHREFHRWAKSSRPFFPCRAW